MTPIDPAATRFTSWLKARSERRGVLPEFTVSDVATHLGWTEDNALALVRSMCKRGKAVDGGKAGKRTTATTIYRLTEGAPQ